MEQVLPFRPAVTAGHDPAARRAVALWLLACCALVFVMIVVGGSAA